MVKALQGKSQQSKQTKPTVFACNVAALSAAERTQYAELHKKLLGLKPRVIELKSGYELRFVNGTAALPIATRWMALESKCCPFFDFSLKAIRNGGPLALQITGATGVKAFIRAELGIGARS